jgi:hypothetical protein
MVKKLIFVNSADRTVLSLSSSAFHVELNRSYNCVQSIRLISYEIANTIYNINNVNNTLRFVENSGASIINVTLTNGSYNASTLATHIQTLMNTNTANAITYTVVYDSITFKYTITADILNFHFDFTISNSVYIEMGFDQVVYSDATSVVSSNAIRLDTASGLLEMDISNNIDTTNQSVNFSWLIELPQLGTVHSRYINNTYSHDVPVTTSTIRSFEIRLKDTQNRTLDFNNSNHTFLFELSLKN